MKRCLIPILFITLLFPLPFESVGPASSIAEAQSREVRANRRLAQALDLARAGKYQQASIELFKMSRSIMFRDRRMQIRYVLGLMLYEMGLYQTSAFQFSEVVRDGESKYVTQSLQKLALLSAEALDSDVMLNYALGKVNLRSFPEEHRDKLRFRIGEIQYNTGQFQKAARILEGVPSNSEFYAKAKYLQGLSFAEMGKLRSAAKAYMQLVESRARQPITDESRVTGLMGIARVAYQMKNWEQAIEYYREIPRDTEQWHESLFELSWAQMRAAQFRSVLSNFHSLHSPYYEYHYQPESLLLRSIVYLYICQYEEMEKTLDIFEKVYFLVRDNLISYVRRNNPKEAYKDFEQFFIQFKKNVPTEEISTKIPLMVAKAIANEGDVQRSMNYIITLTRENKLIENLSPEWQQSGIGKYSKRLVEIRLRNAKATAGQQILRHMRRMRRELAELSEQHGFARYEMINGKKQALKQKIAEKETKQPTLVEDKDRDFFIQNGYEFWPFQGEYWLDEIGNYYYLGKPSCE